MPDNNITPNQNTILEKIILHKTGDGFGHKAASPSSAQRLQLLARNIARRQSGNNLTLTTGLGLSDQGVPLRLPALLLPGLQMMRALKPTGVKTNYIIYQATDFILQANGLNHNQAEQNSVIAIQYAKNFIAEFFPDLTNNIKIVSGPECAIDEKHLHNLMNDLENKIGSAIDHVRRYARGHNDNEKTHLAYAAANIILNGGYQHHYPLQHLLPDNTSLIVPVGGRREKPFFQLTEEMATDTGCDHAVAGLILPVGNVPTYYPCSRGDLLIGQDCNKESNDNLPADIRDDFSILENNGITLGDLRSLAPQYDLENKIKTQPAVQQFPLQGMAI